MTKSLQTFPYSPGRNPPAPMINIGITNPETRSTATEVFLLDSGADITCLKEELLEKLSLEYCGYVKVRSATGEQILRTAAVLLQTPVGDYELIDVTIASTVKINLLGRDLLNKWKVTLDGPNQQMTIEI